MACYFRHLQTVLNKAGIEVTKENKQELDKIIHEIVRVKYKDCPNTWKEVKKRIAADEEGFATELKKRWNKPPQVGVNLFLFGRMCRVTALSGRSCMFLESDHA
jgi:hypothetical protein